MEEKLIDLKDTAAGMMSPDYKERFVAEYHQLRTRLAKLSSFIAKIKTAKEKGEPVPKHDCPLWVLEAQAEAMAKYQALLEIRAKDYEGVDLSVPE